MLVCLFHYSLEQRNGLFLCSIFQRSRIIEVIRMQFKCFQLQLEISTRIFCPSSSSEIMLILPAPSCCVLHSTGTRSTHRKQSTISPHSQRWEFSQKNVAWHVPAFSFWKQFEGQHSTNLSCFHPSTQHLAHLQTALEFWICNRCSVMGQGIRKELRMVTRSTNLQQAKIKSLG